MSNQKIDLHITAEDGAVITLREGAALPLKEPVPVRLSGVLDSPLAWIQKNTSYVAENDSHVVFNREKMTIELVVDENNHYRDIITGSLQLHPTFIKFGINTDKTMSHYEMAKFFKMNRSAFEVQATAMTLVHQLQNFKAKIDREIESSDDKRGNARELRAQAVSHNLPESFNLNIPIFKGMDKEVFPVEVDVNADDLSCTLISPVAADLIEEYRDREIDRVIGAIRELVPGLPIIEQ